MPALPRAKLRHSLMRRFLPLLAFVAINLCGVEGSAQAEQWPPLQPQIMVNGEGSVTAAPDYAEIDGGVTTRGATAKEAADANAKAMAAITAALLDSGIEQKDIRTSQFSVQPIYASPQAGTEQKLSGFAVSNQIGVKVHSLPKLGDILDRMISAGATDIGNIELLHADTSVLLDRAREAAMADARRKAELYARLSGVKLGGVAWIAEDSADRPTPMAAMRAVAGSAPPIAAGEDTLQTRITVGYSIVR